MKKTISIFASALALLFVASSCSNKGETDGTQAGGGKMSFTFGFSDAVTEEDYNASLGRATASTAKPTTSWNGNIKDMMILCVTGNTVRAARTVDVAVDRTTTAQIFTGLPEGTYTIYGIANARQNDIDGYFGTTATTWNESNVVGQNINDLLLKLKKMATQPTVGIPTGTYNYCNAAAEIFVGSLNPVTISSTGPNTPANISLTRVISLMRVRIDQTTDETPANATVDFKTTNGLLQIRRATLQSSIMNGITGDTRDAANVIYVNSPFKNADPIAADGYTGSMGLSTGDVTLWSDVRMFPGGSLTNGSQKFDILISGMAPAGYMTLENTTVPAGGQRVYWSGQVTGAVNANEILDIAFVLKTKGSTTPPGVILTGNLELLATLVGWGNIINIGMDL